MCTWPRNRYLALASLPWPRSQTMLLEVTTVMDRPLNQHQLLNHIYSPGFNSPFFASFFFSHTLHDIMPSVMFSFSFSIYTMPSRGIELCYHPREDWEVPVPWEGPFWTFSLLPYLSRGSITSWSPTLPHHSHTLLLSDPSPWFSPYDLFIARWIYNIFIDVVTPLWHTLESSRPQRYIRLPR